ncbi:hypothetical protein PPL_11198 [Heterostelium album PN500]|uniref:F-box domain-containing protein n=1 Tax=Heterostelium pallidum (strain ATCC 26659 / Pp 5 / PN500) TaxID=670386 RepID=D3BTT8_HETP5|nr:hypothetical protein PPL_11198 [Heterostelium album PN500]EFA75124.1 hypothetical protein PPL_11198 [Heterostelium album PN500]|eukprot:XP_020427258.1 hypothetical protein PPL_11198 [Heterostelium album PN500]
MNNQPNIIVNLSHLILNKIISHLDDNVDIICFSLVCKRWYDERDKYLIFNIDRIDLFALNTFDIKQNNEHFKLPSYHNNFLKSIQSKTNCKLAIGDFVSDSYDYHCDDATSLNSIPSNVSTIYISSRYSYHHDNLEYLHKLISESHSVTTFDGCSTLKYGLSNSMKTLRFDHTFDEPLVKGSLPASLEELDFEEDFNLEIPPGVLPDGLRKLTLNNYQFELQPGVLPSSLTYLNLTSFNDPFNEDLQSYCSNESTTGENSLLEKSCVPISWLQEIQSLRNLKTLYIYLPHRVGGEVTIFNLKYLPPNLETLDITLLRQECFLRGTMPTSLKRIYIQDCHFKFNEIFPETLKYHLDVLEYENNITLPIPSNIKIDTLAIRGTLKESTISLPSGVRSISFLTAPFDPITNLFDFGEKSATDQSCSLRDLRLPTFRTKPPPNTVILPSSIESLDLGWNNPNETFHLIPPTLKTLVLEKTSKINITIPDTIKSITNITLKFELFYTQSIRKLDENYYLIFGECSGVSGREDRCPKETVNIYLIN